MKRIIDYTVTHYSPEGEGDASATVSATIGELLFSRLGLVHGFFPPLEVLNEITRSGCHVLSGNVAFQWSPFSVTDDEYSQLKREVVEKLEWDVTVDESFSGSKEDFGHWAFIQALTHGKRPR